MRLEDRSLCSAAANCTAQEFEKKPKMAARVYHPDHHKAPTRNPPRKNGSMTSKQLPPPPESFQSIIDSVEVFTSSGKNPTLKTAIKGSVHRIYDRGVKGYAYALEGSGGSSKLQLPRDAAKGLGLVQRFLVLQIEVPPDPAALAFEIAITDAKRVRRRLLFSTSFQNLTISTLHAQIPLSFFIAPMRGGWANFTIDLISFTSLCFSRGGSGNSHINVNYDHSSFRKLESITISPVCKIRKVFTMKSPPTQNFYYGDEDDECDYHENECVEIPPLHLLPEGIDPVPKTTIFNANSFVSQPKLDTGASGLSGRPNTTNRNPSMNTQARKTKTNLSVMAARLNARGTNRPAATVNNTKQGGGQGSSHSSVTVERSTQRGSDRDRPPVTRTNIASRSNPNIEVSTPPASRGTPKVAHVAFGSRCEPRVAASPRVSSQKPSESSTPLSVRSRKGASTPSSRDDRRTLQRTTDPNDLAPPVPPMSGRYYDSGPVDDEVHMRTSQREPQAKDTPVMGSPTTLPPPPLDVSSICPSDMRQKSPYEATVYSPYPPPSAPPSASSAQYRPNIQPRSSGDHQYPVVDRSPDEFDFYGGSYRLNDPIFGGDQGDSDIYHDDKERTTEDYYLLGQTPLGESLKQGIHQPEQTKPLSMPDAPLSLSSFEMRRMMSNHTSRGEVLGDEGSEHRLMEISSANPWDDAVASSPFIKAQLTPKQQGHHPPTESDFFRYDEKENNEVHKNIINISPLQPTAASVLINHSGDDSAASLGTIGKFDGSPTKNHDGATNPLRPSQERYMGETTSRSKAQVRRSDEEDEMNSNEKDAQEFLQREWVLQQARKSNDSFGRRSVESSSNRSVGSPGRRSVESSSNRSVGSPGRRSVESGSNRSVGSPGRRSVESGSNRSLKFNNGQSFTHMMSEDLYVGAYLASPKDFDKPPSPIRSPRTSQEFPSTGGNSVVLSARSSFEKEKNKIMASTGSRSQSVKVSNSSSTSNIRKSQQRSYIPSEFEQGQQYGRKDIKTNQFSSFSESNKHRFPINFNDDDNRSHDKDAEVKSREEIQVSDELSPTFDGSLEQFPNTTYPPSSTQMNFDESFGLEESGSNVLAELERREQELLDMEAAYTDGDSGAAMNSDHIKIDSSQMNFDGSFGLEESGSNVLAELERREQELLDMEAAYNNDQELAGNDDDDDEHLCLFGTQTDLNSQLPNTTVDYNNEKHIHEQSSEADNNDDDDDDMLLFNGLNLPSNEQRDVMSANSMVTPEVSQSPERIEGMSEQSRPNQNQRPQVFDSFTTNNSYFVAPSDLGTSMSSMLENSQPQVDGGRTEGNADDEQVVGDDSLELMFNPILNCYYDPKTGKFYQLKDD